MSAKLALTAEQEAAATCESSSVVVCAGPGSGKTSCLSARISWLLERVAPESIVALTFTRSACANIRRKVADQVGEALADRVTIATFHGYAWSLVQRPGLSVTSEVDAKAAIDSLYAGLIPRGKRHVPARRKLEDALMRHESGVGPISDLEANGIDILRARLTNSRQVPTWDLLPSLETIPTGLHVLVDEGQDVTPNERALVEVLSGGGTFFAVYDQRQAIMGWRGARGMGLEPTHRLTHSFRFGPEIAAAANHVAAMMGADPIVGGGPAGEVVECELEAILEQEGSRAVLCRTHVECADVARRLGDVAVHVRRDPFDGLAEDADRYEEIARSGRVAVSTIHSAKGREWDAVAIMPMRESDEPEETRVQYVAATRARGWVGIVS